MSDFDRKGTMSDVIESLSKKYNLILTHPSMIPQLIDSGVSIEEVPIKLSKEGLNKLFESQRSRAFDLIDKLPLSISNQPAIQQLYTEIYYCILFGRNGAAITLCGILVEFTLRYVILNWENKESESGYNPEQWDRMEKIFFSGLLQQAKDLGIITEAEATYFANFKNEVRNPYNHYNIKKITKEVVFRNVAILDAATKQVTVKDISSQENPGFFSIAKPWFDRFILPWVVDATYQNVQMLLNKLDAKWNLGSDK